MEYHILRKNGEIIYSGPEWETVSRLVPRWHTDHNGDKYSLSHIESRNGSIRISHGEDVKRPHIDGDIRGLARVNIPREDLRVLVENISQDL